MARHRQPAGPKRKEKSRQRRRFLIVSEDSKSSLDYFKCFPVDERLVEIVSEGGAGNTKDVVQRGINLKEAAIAEKRPFAHIYCVFDKDDWDLDRYQAAFDKAAQHNDVTAVWANECFEIWYLLHYAYHDASMGRDQVYARLKAKSRLGKAYKKGDATIYAALKSKQGKALECSKKLLFWAQQEFPKCPARVNPSTNVHELVDRLNELQELPRP
jgi:hypothetical protein